MAIGLAGQLLIGLSTGLLVGAFHFSSLSWNTRLFAQGSPRKALALQLGRIAVLILLARLLGFAASLCGALGFLVARPLLLWRFGALR